MIRFLFFLSLIINSQNYNERFENLFKEAVYSFKISKVDGSEIVSINPNKLLIVGSTVKVLTTLYALDKLGPDYRFKTYLKYNGYIKNKVLYGDLYIIGGGDMTLGSQNFKKSIENVFDEMFDIINRKINRVKGNLYIISSFNDLPHPTWEWQDVGNYYAARPTFLSINDNSYMVYFKLGKNIGDKTTIVKIEPDVEVNVENEVVTGVEGSGDNSYIYSNPYMNKIIIKGSIGKTDNLFAIKGSMNSPVDYFAKSFFKFLNDKGIKIKKYIILDREKQGLKDIDIIYSPPLYEIIKLTNKKSFNFYAESLIRYAGINEGIIGLENLNGLKKYLEGIGVEKFNIVDGSGLSKQNIFSCDGFIKVLNDAKTKQYFDYFYDSLVFAGDKMAKGNIKRFGLEKELDLRIKSGSLNMVRSYVGYINSKQNGLLSFCFIINNYSISPSQIDNFLEDLLSEF